eukprot:1484811-Lingulodinium_polyedra.AAC.1
MARLRTPCTHQKTGARVECASVRFACRCNGGRSIRPHGCVAFRKRCATMRSNRPFVAAAARKSHVCALRERARKLARSR